MKLIVIDVSMAVACTLPDEKSERSESLLLEAEGFRRITIGLFWYEYRNLLVSNERRGRVLKTEIPHLLEDAQTLEIELHDIAAHEWIISLAFKHKLSAYDAAYLALALREGAILATNDRRLAQAAFAEGVELRTALAA